MHSSVDGYLGCFYFLAIRNNAAVNIYVQVFVTLCFQFSWVYIPRTRIGGSYGSSMLSFVRNYQTVFQSGYSI